MTAPSRRIPDQSRSSPMLFWAFAVLFTVITSPFLLMPFPRLIKVPLAIVDGVLFAAALVVSIRGSRSHPVLVLENVPVSISGTLRGHIEIPADPQRFANARSIKREADWIAQQICERLGLPPKNSFAERSDQQKVAS